MGYLVVTCCALLANLRVTTEKEGSVFSVCAIFSQENGMFPLFRLFHFSFSRSMFSCLVLAGKQKNVFYGKQKNVFSGKQKNVFLLACWCISENAWVLATDRPTNQPTDHVTT
jgi:hypothetical protein